MMGEEDLGFEYEFNGNNLRMIGRITFKLATDTFRDMIRKMTKCQYDHILVDMCDVVFIDSTGVGFFMIFKYELDQVNKTFELLNVKNQAKRVMQVCGIHSNIKINYVQ